MASDVADPLPVEDIDEDVAAETELEEESIDETETNEEEAIPDEPSDDISPVANVTDMTQEGEKGMWLTKNIRTPSYGNDSFIRMNH